MPLPDFVIIGAMKSGTTTLHEQLALQPQFFMSEPKEPYYFSDDPVFARGQEWYETLFNNAPDGAIKGESSTHYTKLPTHPATIERLAPILPNAKFIYVMRHPIDRLVSHYIHAWSERETDAPIDTAISDLPQLIDYSRYGYQLTPWVETFGAEKIHLIFFEQMTANPQAVLTRAAQFLGADGPVTWRDAKDAANVSAKRMRQHPALKAIVDNPALAAVRRAFVPQSWRDKIKAQLVMKERPTLSDDSKEMLRKIFDQDLATLTPLVGVELNCENFKERVCANSGDD